ncbi:hypothetical protein [Pseudomonas hefeiensis]|uniref:Uncharacterized protein n=1 Tax=Pseudomonas hefeiensis TaxID=2738125 RepID=A0ABY9G8Y3_9PSED|nr:hypothetical protein [Pseudomonas sp. FP205]WLH12007.1 hypothetical protein PSH57_24750 [Pseudomonas sp. FP205]
MHYLNTQIAEGTDIDLAGFNQRLKTHSLTSLLEKYPVLRTCCLIC